MKDISISSTTIFSYNLGCGDESPVFVVSPEGEGWVRVNVTGNSFTVNIDPYDGEGIRTADVKIKFGDTVCSGGIKVRQEGSGGGDECTYTYTLDLLPREGVTIDSSGNTKTITANGTRLCNGETDNTFTPRYNWTKPSDADWLTLSNAQSATVTVSANKNCETDKDVSLTCYLIDNNVEKINKQVRVFQAGEECEPCSAFTSNAWIEYDISTVNLGACGGSSGITVTGKYHCNEIVDTYENYTPEISFTRTGNSDIAVSKTGTNTLEISADKNCGTEARTTIITITAKDKDGVGNANIGPNSGQITITQDVCDDCGGDEPEPETREYEFDVDFGDLRGEAFHYANNGDYSDQKYTINVTSGTRTNSSSQWEWSDIDYTFSKGIPDGTAGFVLTQKSAQNEVRTYEVSITGTPENSEVHNIILKITQSANPDTTANSRQRAFTFSGAEPDYRYNELRPFMVKVPYEQSRSFQYYLFFKSYGNMNGDQREIEVNKKVTFFATQGDVFVTNISDGNCAGQVDTVVPTVSKRPYMLAGEKSNYQPNYMISDIMNRGVFIREVTQECDQYQLNYLQDYTALSFKVDDTTCQVINGYKGSDGFPDSCRDGVNDVCLIIPRNQDIETITADIIILRASQVTFNAREDNEVSVSVYEDGAVFVDEASGNVATVNERFQNITQFVNTVYPSGYTDIQACQLFNGTVPLDDFGQHTCFNDIVIEDGELIRRDESIPSPTVAMHIELDEEPSDTQAMHIETDNN